MRSAKGTTKMAKRWLACIAISAVLVSSGARAEPTLQDFDTTGQFERALAAVDAIKARKRLQCILAIASRALCECLSRKLPVDTYPRSYASIAKQENEYEQLSVADKKIVGQCIGESR